MRLKPVPPASDDVEGLRAARRAVPLVPGTEDDCCARLQERLGLPARDEARTWLTFLRALDLVEETARGYVRTRKDLDSDAAGEQFREGVFGAREILETLVAAEEPLTATETFERVEPLVPQWERHKDPDWRDTWRDRVGRLLEWAAVFGLAERADGGYRSPAQRSE